MTLHSFHQESLSHLGRRAQDRTRSDSEGSAVLKRIHAVRVSNPARLAKDRPTGHGGRVGGWCEDVLLRMAGLLNIVAD